MTNKKLLLRLKEMVNQNFNYAKSVHYVQDVKIDDDAETFTIITNQNQYTRKFENADAFLQYWEPAGASLPTKSDRSVSVFIEQDNTLADEMIKILKDNIDKVKADPKYIPQAQVINNNVNSVINVVKLKMAFAREMNRKQ